MSNSLDTWRDTNSFNIIISNVKVLCTQFYFHHGKRVKQWKTFKTKSSTVRTTFKYFPPAFWVLSFLALQF